MSDDIIIRDGDVDTAVIAEYEQSRRDLMRRGLVVGGAVVAATTVPFLLGARNAMAQAEGDAAILEAAIGLEQTAVFAYKAAADSGKLGKATAVATLFAKQEQEHADALIQALEGLGGKAPAKPKGVEDVEGLAKAAGGDATDILNYAVEIETMAVGAYYDAHGKLKTPELLSAGASIMANEAQHLVVLRQALKKNPSPDAFVTGGKG
jgi:rubrerythrin